MQIGRNNSHWLAIALSAVFGIASGAGFVALHFPPESGEYHLSQFWESAVLSAVSIASWLCLCLAAMKLQSYNTASRKKLRFVWYASLYISLAIGLFVAWLLGYGMFTGAERDWFKVHDRFVLSEYLEVSIEFGLGYGALVGAISAGVLSSLLGLFAVFKKLTHRSTAVG